MGVLRHHLFLCKSKVFVQNKYLFIFKVWYVTDICSDTICKPSWKFRLYALTIAINVPVVIYQLPIC